MIRFIFPDKPNITAGNHPLKYVLHTMRFYGEPKIKKPKELRGIRQSFSVDYIPDKCRCGVFLHKDDVWVKCRDYFSAEMRVAPEDIGTPLSVRARKYLGNKSVPRKFAYEDNWGGIVLRNEAWIKLENLRYWLDSRLWMNEGRMILTVRDELFRQVERLHDFEVYSLTCSDMGRFIEGVVFEVLKYEREGR